jgi:hypothetical protein
MAQVRESFIDSGSIMVLSDSQWEKFSSCEILKTFVTIVCSGMGEEATSLLQEVCSCLAKRSGRMKWTVHFILSLEVQAK